MYFVFFVVFSGDEKRSHANMTTTRALISVEAVRMNNLENGLLVCVNICGL